MKSISTAIQELSYSSSRFETFKRLFNVFQSNIAKLDSNSLSGKIVVETASDLKSTVEFIGRNYEFNFSTRFENDTLVGVINFLRIFESGEVKEVKSISFKGEGTINIDPPQGADPLSLNEDVACINLAANCILEELNT